LYAKKARRISSCASIGFPRQENSDMALAWRGIMLACAQTRHWQALAESELIALILRFLPNPKFAAPSLVFFRKFSNQSIDKEILK
jgi:hypothetical protein